MPTERPVRAAALICAIALADDFLAELDEEILLPKLLPCVQQALRELLTIGLDPFIGDLRVDQQSCVLDYMVGEESVIQGTGILMGDSSEAEMEAYFDAVLLPTVERALDLCLPEP